MASAKPRWQVVGEAVVVFPGLTGEQQYSVVFPRPTIQGPQCSCIDNTVLQFTNTFIFRKQQQLQLNVKPFKAVCLFPCLV